MDNYVEVVQHVPINILMDEPPDPAHSLGPGMSVVPTVTVQEVAAQPLPPVVCAHTADRVRAADERDRS